MKAEMAARSPSTGNPRTTRGSISLPRSRVGILHSIMGLSFGNRSKHLFLLISKPIDDNGMSRALKPFITSSRGPTKQPSSAYHKSSNVGEKLLRARSSALESAIANNAGPAGSPC